MVSHAWCGAALRPKIRHIVPTYCKCAAFAVSLNCFDLLLFKLNLMTVSSGTIAFSPNYLHQIFQNTSPEEKPVQISSLTFFR